MKIVIASDHAGFEMKRELSTFVQTLGYEIRDFGADTLNLDDDYPDFIMPLARAVVANPALKGIIIGGSGQGEAIAANRYVGVRATVFYGYVKSADGKELPDIVRLFRDHNDSNVLSLGARFLSIDDAKKAVKIWLETPFSNDQRHVRRIQKLDKLD
jgi:ribose 5-phosphate isomerase B